MQGERCDQHIWEGRRRAGVVDSVSGDNSRLCDSPAISELLRLNQGKSSCGNQTMDPELG